MPSGFFLGTAFHSSGILVDLGEFRKLFLKLLEEHHVVSYGFHFLLSMFHYELKNAIRFCWPVCNVPRITEVLYASEFTV